MRKAASHLYSFLSIFVIFLLFLSVFSYFSVVYAWSTKQRVSVSCVSNTVFLNVSFTNTELQHSGKGMYVVATDEQSGRSVDLGAVMPSRSVEGVIETGLTAVGSGKVRFDLTWVSGKSGTDTRYVSYGAFHCASATPEPTDCVTPTPTSTPRPTKTPMPTVVPTVTPSLHPTATPTAHPTVTPSASPSATPTVVPTIHPTPIPTATPIVADTTPSASPRTDLSDGRSDGRQDALDCVPGSKYGRTSCNTTSSSAVVSGVSTHSLPSTGAGSEGSVFAVFSLFGLLFGVWVHFIARLKQKRALAEYEATREVVYVNLKYS